MSDTPETDKFIVSAGYVRTDHQWRTFARKLERERNNLQDQRDFCMGEIERLKQERDALRDAINALYEYATVRDHFAKDVSEALNGAMRLNC